MLRLLPTLVVLTTCGVLLVRPASVDEVVTRVIDIEADVLREAVAFVLFVALLLLVVLCAEAPRVTWSTRGACRFILDRVVIVVTDTDDVCVAGVGLLMLLLVAAFLKRPVTLLVGRLLLSRLTAAAAAAAVFAVVVAGSAGRVARGNAASALA